jgi:hypothetical protein
MKSFVRTIVIAAGFLLLAGIQDARAQIFETVEFTAPFDFTVGPVTMRAGSYTIRPDNDSPDILEITGEHTAAFFATEHADPRETPSQTEIVFKLYGDRYLLKQIWVEGSVRGAEAIVAEGERHMARLGASSRDQRVVAKKTTEAGN